MSEWPRDMIHNVFLKHRTGPLITKLKKHTWNGILERNNLTWFIDREYWLAAVLLIHSVLLPAAFPWLSSVSSFKASSSTTPFISIGLFQGMMMSSFMDRKFAEFKIRTTGLQSVQLDYIAIKTDWLHAMTGVYSSLLASCRWILVIFAGIIYQWYHTRVIPYQW